HASDAEAIEQFARDFADAIQALQTETALVRGDLEHAVGRGVADRLAGAQMFFAEFLDDLRAGCVTIAEHARQLRALAQRLDQFARKARLLAREIAPVLAHRRAGDFPVPGLRILARRSFRRGAGAAAVPAARLQAGRRAAGGNAACFAQTQ